MKILMTIESEVGTRYEVFKQDDGAYGFNYHEFYSGYGWRLLFTKNNYSKEALEDLLDCEIPE